LTNTRVRVLGEDCIDKLIGWRITDRRGW